MAGGGRRGTVGGRRAAGGGRGEAGPAAYSDAAGCGRPKGIENFSFLFLSRSDINSSMESIEEYFCRLLRVRCLLNESKVPKPLLIDFVSLLFLCDPKVASLFRLRCEVFSSSFLCGVSFVCDSGRQSLNQIVDFLRMCRRYAAQLHASNLLSHFGMSRHRELVRVCVDLLLHY